MDCRAVKEIIPAYLANAATLDEVAKIEAHLSVCQECRLYLGKMIDEPVKADLKPESRVPTPTPVPVPAVKAPPIVKTKAKSKSVDDALTPLDYGALIVGIMILGFLLFLFAKK